MTTTLSKRILALRVACTTGATLALLGGYQVLSGAPVSDPEPTPTSTKVGTYYDPDHPFTDCCTGRIKYYPWDVPIYMSDPACLQCHAPSSGPGFALVEGAEGSTCIRNDP